MGSNVESREQHVYRYRHITHPEQLRESASMTLLSNLVFNLQATGDVEMLEKGCAND